MGTLLSLWNFDCRARHKSGFGKTLLADPMDSPTPQKTSIHPMGINDDYWWFTEFPKKKCRTWPLAAMQGAWTGALLTVTRCSFPYLDGNSVENTRPNGLGHPPQPHRGARGDCPAACLVGHRSDMVSFGLVQGCFKMYWCQFRVGFRVGLRFLQGFLMICFRVYLGLT